MGEARKTTGFPCGAGSRGRPLEHYPAGITRDIGHAWGPKEWVGLHKAKQQVWIWVKDYTPNSNAELWLMERNHINPLPSMACEGDFGPLYWAVRKVTPEEVNYELLFGDACNHRT